MSEPRILPCQTCGNPHAVKRGLHSAKDCRACFLKKQRRLIGQFHRDLRSRNRKTKL